MSNASRLRLVIALAFVTLGDVPIAVEIVSGGSSLLVIREW